MESLIRYWIEFEIDENTRAALPYAGIKRGCGVTAYGVEDAKYLLQTAVFKDIPLLSIRNIQENIDVSTLDPGHVLPNIGTPNVRGIWYPSI